MGKALKVCLACWACAWWSEAACSAWPGSAFEENRASDHVQRQGAPSVASHLGECMMRALIWTTAGTAISATCVLLAAVGVVGWLVGRKGPQPPGAEPNESHRVA